MPPLPGLRTTYLTLTAVKRAGVAAISNVQQRTITEEQWLLSPGGATSLMPWAQAHGYQAAVAPAASSWLTKDDSSYRAATGGAFDSMDPRAARWNKLCWSAARSPPIAPAAGGRRLAPTALKMPPLPGLRTTYLTLTAVKRAGVAAISNVQQRTITEEQWLLSPGGATSLMPWAQAGASPRLPSRSRPGGEQLVNQRR